MWHVPQLPKLPQNVARATFAIIRPQLSRFWGFFTNFDGTTPIIWQSIHRAPDLSGIRVSPLVLGKYEYYGQLADRSLSVSALVRSSDKQWQPARRSLGLSAEVRTLNKHGNLANRSLGLPAEVRGSNKQRQLAAKSLTIFLPGRLSPFF